jgi:ribA/ribD-fused uncharacterized protein
MNETKKSEPITCFDEEYRFLSNFYPARIKFEGSFYKSVEHAYQAAKCKNIEDRAKFRENIKASRAKTLGKKVDMRPDWESVKLSVMYDCVKYKFTHDFYCQKKLLETENRELIEGNDWGDVFWGVCDGKGHNHLGKILMRVREEIMEDIKC